MSAIGAIALATSLVGGMGAASAAASPIKVPLALSSSAEAGILECVGETVTVSSGTFNVILSLSARHSFFHRNIMDGRAVGDVSGSTYVVTGHIQEVENIPVGGGYVYTYDVTLHVVEQKGGDSFTAQGLMHLTVTPAGEFTSVTDDFSIRCGA